MPRGDGSRAAVTLLLVRQTNPTLVQYAVHEVPAEDADLHAAQWARAGFSVLARYPSYDAAHAEAHRRCPNPVAVPGS
jgi:hypothetical protein